jgi:hypothetical protein
LRFERKLALDHNAVLNNANAPSFRRYQDRDEVVKGHDIHVLLGEGRGSDSNNRRVQRLSARISEEEVSFIGDGAKSFPQSVLLDLI